MKLAIAAIVAVSVLVMPTEGAAQSNPPKTIIEKWSCTGEITLTSSCTQSGTCSGSFKLGNYPAKKTNFDLMGPHRGWSWQEDDRPRLLFIITANGNGVFGSGKRREGSTVHSTHRCRKTQ